MGSKNRKEGKTAEEWFELGVSAVDPQQKIKYYSNCIELYPENAAAWNNKGVTIKKLGRYEEAITCYDKALAITPKGTGAWTNKGIALDNLGRYEEAIKCFDIALGIDPKNAAAWKNKARVIDNLRRYEEVIRSGKALDIDPKNAAAWKNKGRALGESGNWEEALRCYEKALELDPRNADALNDKGVILVILQRYEEALRCAEKALELDPRNPRAWDNKGTVLLNMGREEEALLCYDKVRFYEKALRAGEKSEFAQEPTIKEPRPTAPIQPESSITIASAFGYKGATILYKIKVTNITDEPVGDIKVSLLVPEVFLLREHEKKIAMLEPNESNTVTFEVRPTGECGECNVSGTVKYYDYRTKKRQEAEIEPKVLRIICPILKPKRIDKTAWKDTVFRLISAQESTKDIQIPAETLFTMVSRVIKDMNMLMLEPEITSTPQLFNGVARFFAEGVKGLQYAAQIEVIGGLKDSKLIMKTWAEQEEALTGFYHGLLDEIEKRVHVKCYIEGINIFVKGDYFAEDARKIDVMGDYQERGAIKTGDIGMIKGGMRTADKAVIQCPHCGNEIETTAKFCPDCGTNLK